MWNLGCRYLDSQNYSNESVASHDRKMVFLRTEIWLRGIDSSVGVFAILSFFSSERVGVHYRSWSTRSKRMHWMECPAIEKEGTLLEVTGMVKPSVIMDAPDRETVSKLLG
ncbi:hypothetical protein Tco_0470821 [Tanacetum coccineum]